MTQLEKFELLQILPRCYIALRQLVQLKHTHLLIGLLFKRLKRQFHMQGRKARPDLPCYLILVVGSNDIW